MYFTEDTDGKELHYLIDRKNDYYYVPGLHFPVPGNEQAFHIGTLIDGELVLDNTKDGGKQLKYLVFDCLTLDNNILMNRTLDKRLAYFRERVYLPYEKLYKDYPEELQYVPFIVEFKSMQFSYGIDMMFNSILPSLPHGNDGLVFTCRNTEYTHGTDQHILKWKPENENSVDFRLNLVFPLVKPDLIDLADGVTEPYLDYDALPECHLHVNMGDSRPGVDDWYGTMYLEPAEWERLKALNEPLDDRIVECYMDAQKRWRYMRFRDDKTEANYVGTVESVIESITDRVTKGDLMRQAGVIREKWKERQRAEAEGRGRGGGGIGVKRKVDELGQ